MESQGDGGQTSTRSGDKERLSSTLRAIETSTAEFCSHCSNLIHQWQKISNRRQIKVNHCQNLFILESSAQAGCSLCAQFLDDKDKEALSRCRSVMANVLADEVEIFSEVLVEPDSNDRQSWRLTLEFKGCSGEKVEGDVYGSCTFCVLAILSSRTCRWCSRSK